MTESPLLQLGRGESDIDRITASLVSRFSELPSDVVRRSVQRNHDAFDGCPIRGYLAILTEKAARKELQETAQNHRRNT